MATKKYIDRREWLDSKGVRYVSAYCIDYGSIFDGSAEGAFRLHDGNDTALVCGGSSVFRKIAKAASDLADAIDKADADRKAKKTKKK